ncbi:NAD(P)/FAD-dependent oxidoreductase [Rudanella paleaurantiibacter]|nr:NAD(P)/FAD-dependent oxidoreductase [Rudanella paleaurantiibacter]
MRSIVIIGNGIAGITAAREIRKRSDDSLTVISSETDHFFSRTALMYVYMGQLEPHHLKPYEDWFWPKNRINLLRAHVEKINFDQKTLFLSGSSAGEELSYDVLILALGSTPNPLGLPGEQLAGVQGLYGLPDLARMQADTVGVREAVVVGGGLIGIELCEMLLSKGIRPTFVVREKSYWNSVLPDEESALVTNHIREHHVDLRLNTELTGLIDDGSGRVGQVTTSTGETLPAQFVGISVGVRPNIHFLRHTALETDRGILVNNFLETNLPDVYAIGDCVQHRIPPPGRKPLEQIWYTGRIMGETLAQTLTGTQTAYRPGVFFNSAKFFDIEYQTYGNAPARPDEHPDLQSFYWQHETRKLALRIYFRADTGAVVGMNTLGIRQRQAVWTEWIETEKPIGWIIGHLVDANFDPEFFRRYEPDMAAQFTRQFPQWPVETRPKKRLLFSW